MVVDSIDLIQFKGWKYRFKLLELKLTRRAIKELESRREGTRVSTQHIPRNIIAIETKATI